MSNFLTGPQLVFAMNKLYPELVINKDYWVGAPTDGLAGPQKEDARIFNWSSELVEPDPQELKQKALALIPEYEKELASFAANLIVKAQVIKSRFTLEELVAIREAATTNPIIGLLYDTLNGSGTINLEDSTFLTQIQTLVQDKIITNSRELAIITPSSILF